MEIMDLIKEFFELTKKQDNISKAITGVILITLFIVINKKFGIILSTFFPTKLEKATMTPREKIQRGINALVVIAIVSAFFVVEIAGVSLFNENQQLNETYIVSFGLTFLLITIILVLIGFIGSLIVIPLLNRYMNKNHQYYYVRLNNKEYDFGEVHSDGTVELIEKSNNKQTIIKLMSKQDLSNADIILETYKKENKTSLSKRGEHK